MINELITDPDQIHEFLNFVKQNYDTGFFHLNIWDKNKLYERFNKYYSIDNYNCKGLLGKICKDCNPDIKPNENAELLGYKFIEPTSGDAVIDMLICEKYKLIVNLSHEFGHLLNNEKCKIFSEMKAQQTDKEILTNYFKSCKNKNLEKACLEYYKEGIGGAPVYERARKILLNQKITQSHR